MNVGSLVWNLKRDLTNLKRDLRIADAKIKELESRNLGLNVEVGDLRDTIKEMLAEK